MSFQKVNGPQLVSQHFLGIEFSKSKMFNCSGSFDAEANSADGIAQISAGTSEDTTTASAVQKETRAGNESAAE